MTLKEKLCEPFDGLRNETAKELETIADEFAIGFAEWILEQPQVKIIKKSGLDNSYMKMSSKELLEIYKKEKGL